MPKPTNNRAKAIVDAAAAGGWAVPAMCLYNLEGIIASVKAAEAMDSPVSKPRQTPINHPLRTDHGIHLFHQSSSSSPGQ